MKKLFTFIVGAVVGLGAYAQDDFYSGTLRYSVLSPDDMTCAVIGYSDRVPNLVIPETVSYGGEDYTVTDIGEEAFRWYSPETLSLPSTLEVIGANAFWNCNGIKELVIPNSVKEIGASSFGACYDLNRVELGPSVELLGDGAFGNGSPVSVVIAKGETPAQCVNGYLNVFTSNPLVAVSEELVAAYESAWEGANVVPNIPAESLSFDPDSYTVQPGGTVQLNWVVSPANAPVRFSTENTDIITVDDNGLVTADKLRGGYGANVTATTLNGFTASCYIETQSLESFESDGFRFAVIPGSENEVAVIWYESDAAVPTIPASVEYNGNVYSVTTIGPDVFNWKGEVEEFVIPASIKLIRENNFRDCSSLKKVTIADSATPLTLSNYNITSNPSLLEVYVGRNVAYTEGDDCFCWNGALSRIVLGPEVTEVPSNMFRGCSYLNFVESQNPVPPVIGENVFGYNNPTIIVPDESVEAYQSAWEYYASNISVAVEAERLYFETNASTIYNGQSIKLPLVVEPEGATVVWSSSIPNLVSVDAEGNVSYGMWNEQVGEATITASTLNGLSADCTVTAKHWLTFAEDKLSMAKGEPYQVEVEMPEQLVESPITWTSSDEEVATVDENGWITAVAYGNAEISADVTVRIEEDRTQSFKYSIKVEVRSEPTGVTAEESVISVWQGGTAPIDLNFEPDDEFVNREMTWTVEDEEIAKVYTEDGVYLVSGLKAGNTIITGTTVSGFSVNIDVIVKTRVEQVDFPKDVIYLSPDESVYLKFTIDPVVTNVTFFYESDNEEVATVDKEGKITAHNLGSTWINVSSENPWGDTDLLGYVRVEVYYFPENVELLNQDIKVVNGQNTPLDLVFSPDGENINKDIEWTIDNPEIAYISRNWYWNPETEENEWYWGAVGRSLGNTAFTGTTLNGLTVNGTISVEGLNMYYGSKDASKMSITIGETVQLEIEANPEELLNTVTFESYNENFATVTPEGQVTGVAAGNVWIGARYIMNDNEYTDQMNVTVHPASGTIAFDHSQIVVKPREWNYLEVIFPKDEEYDVTWDFSDYNVVGFDEYNISNSGAQLVYKGVGTATITATASNGYTAECKVICANPSLNESEFEMRLGQKRQLEVLGLPEDLEVIINWSSNNEGVANVTDGVISAEGTGTTTIFGSIYTSDGELIGDVSAVVEVIYWEPVADITLNPSTIIANKGRSVQIEATVMPEDATDKTLVWSSNNTDVATVDQYGYVTFVGKGDAVITAFDATYEVSATCDVTCLQLSLSETNILMGIDRTRQIEVQGIPADLDVIINWRSDNEYVATVAEDGLIIPQNYGLATITADVYTSDWNWIGSVSTSVEVTDFVYVSEITLNPTKIVIENVGQEVQINATVMPENAMDKTLIWSSSDESVATVNENGLVTIVSNGEAVITASATDGSEVLATCNVAEPFTPVKVTGIELSKEEWDGFVGESVKIHATVTPAHATDKRIIWSTSNESVATVDEWGLVTAIAAGEAVITATVKTNTEISAECKVTVKDVVMIESLTINPETWSGEKGDDFTIEATILPADASYKALKYKSSDTKVAKVDREGNVTLLNVGTCVITVSTTDGSDLTAECEVTVNEPAPVLAESLTITPEEWSGEEGESFRIEATVLPEDTADKTLSFESSNTSVATVDNDGLVTLLREGTCVITVSTSDGSNLTAECLITGVSGIAAILAGSDANIDVYTQQGILIKHNCTVEDLKMLQSGIYIVRRGNIVKTVYLRN